jgi:ubiquitin C-terminal hydrolase
LYPHTRFIDYIADNEVGTHLRTMSAIWHKQQSTTAELNCGVAVFRTLMGAHFDTGSQQDAAEFLYTLLKLTGLDQNMNARYVMVQGNHETVTSRRVEETGVVHYVAQWTTLQSIATLLSYCEDSGVLEVPLLQKYTTVLTTVDFIPLKYMVIHLDRTSISSVNRTPITMSEHIRGHTLVSVVMHLGTSIHSGHYTAFYRRGTHFLYYDDNTTTQVMTPYTLDQCAEQMGRDGILFFYSIIIH